MSFAIDLLEQAEHLAGRETKRPRQASLRRATSASYYALYHLLTSDAASLLVPNGTTATRARVQRIISHNEMKLACSRMLQSPLSQGLASILGMQVTDDLRSVARSFLVLQDARHSADYDLNSTWTRASVRGHVATARDAFRAWDVVRGQQEADLFLLSFVLLKQLDQTR